MEEIYFSPHTVTVLLLSLYQIRKIKHLGWSIDTWFELLTPPQGISQGPAELHLGFDGNSAELIEFYRFYLYKSDFLLTIMLSGLFMKITK